MQKSNFHTHTKYSDGKNTPREIAEYAISIGFHSLGFSDHSYSPKCISYCIAEEAVADYYAEIRSLEKEYEGRIKIYAGIELDCQSMAPEYNYDYVISSVHSLCKNGICYDIDHTAEGFVRMVNEGFNGSSVDMSKEYFERVTEHIMRNKTDIVGHFDLPTKFGMAPEMSDKYIDSAIESLREVIKYCKVFELNTGAIARGIRKVPYPAPFILDEIKKLGGMIVVTSDCHYRERLTVWFDEAEEYLKSHGFVKNDAGVLNEKVHGIEIWA